MTPAIAEAIAPVRAAMQEMLSRRPFRKRLLAHAAKLVVDIRPIHCYYKGTPIEISYMKSTGYVLLDHVRKLRSPGLNSLADAMTARERTLKEHATNDDATTVQQEPTAGLPASE